MCPGICSKVNQVIGLAKPKGHSCHYAIKKKKRKKKRSVKITMHLGSDNIVKLKFTTNVDRCATLKIICQENLKKFNF